MAASNSNGSKHQQWQQAIAWLAMHPHLLSKAIAIAVPIAKQCHQAKACFAMHAHLLSRDNTITVAIAIAVPKINSGNSSNTNSSKQKQWKQTIVLPLSIAWLAMHPPLLSQAIAMAVGNSNGSRQQQWQQAIAMAVGNNSSNSGNI